jgi:excisionase family DNA binding protein
MAETETSDRTLYTLSEISQRTGISMPTLQRYKKMYQSRIPAEGKGRKQRYPEESLPVFEQLRVENAGRRGRPRKDASSSRPAASAGRGRGRKAAAPAPAPAAKRGRKPGAKSAAKPAAKPAAATRGGARGRGGRKAAASGGRSNLLTLGQVSEQTGISYPTLVRYVRLHSNRLPSEGTGRSRRFHPEAVPVFNQLRSESGRGGRKPAAAKATRGPGRGRGRAAAASSSGDTSNQRLKALERAQQDLEKRFRGFVTSLQKLFR